MSRDSELHTIFVPSAARSSAATTTSYFPVVSDIMVKAVTVMGINPAAVDGDTLRVIVDYSPADTTASYTTIADTSADEYNDTDDTASLGTISAPDIRTVGTADWSTTGLAFPGVRVGGNSFLRVQETWAGTVTDGHVQICIHYTPLNATVDAS